MPLSIGVALFLVMATWRWGRKATFAAYSAKPTMTIAELVALHKSCTTFMERNAIVMSPKPVREPTDRTPALIQMLWERHGILPRNLILVEVTHRKVPYIHDGRYQVTVFDREKNRGGVIGVELSFGFMGSRMSSGCWKSSRATRKLICRPNAGIGSCTCRRRICCPCAA